MSADIVTRFAGISPNRTGVGIAAKLAGLVLIGLDSAYATGSIGHPAVWKRISVD